MASALCSQRCLATRSFSSFSRRPKLPGVQSQCRRRGALQVQAKQQRTTGNEAIDNALQVGSGLVESAANLVPESVPRPIAKGGVAVVGALLAFWALQKLVSTVLTIALLGGAAWFYFQQAGSSRDSSSTSGGGGGSSSNSRDAGSTDLNDPLAEARKIMDKYK